jgi:hypothetical protein
MTGDKEAEHLFFIGEPLASLPSRHARQIVGMRPRAGASLKSPNKACSVPAAASRCAFCARSIALSTAAMSCARVPSESSAPALISDSITRWYS